MTLTCALPPEIKGTQYILGFPLFLFFSKKGRDNSPHREDLQHCTQRQQVGHGQLQSEFSPFFQRQFLYQQRFKKAAEFLPLQVKNDNATQRQGNIRLTSIIRMPLPCTSGADSITQELIMQGDSYQRSGIKNPQNKLLLPVQEQDTSANTTYLLQTRQQYSAFYSSPEISSHRAFLCLLFCKHSHYITHSSFSAGSLFNLPTGTKTLADSQHLCHFTALASCSSRALKIRKLCYPAHHIKRGYPFIVGELPAFVVLGQAVWLESTQPKPLISHLLYTKAS